MLSKISSLFAAFLFDTYHIDFCNGKQLQKSIHFGFKYTEKWSLTTWGLQSSR